MRRQGCVLDDGQVFLVYLGHQEIDFQLMVLDVAKAARERILAGSSSLLIRMALLAGYRARMYSTDPSACGRLRTRPVLYSELTGTRTTRSSNWMERLSAR